MCCVTPSCVAFAGRGGGRVRLTYAGRVLLQWWKAATSPRMIGVFLLLVIGAVVCVRLGAWQVDRALASAEQQAAIEQAAREEAPPVPLEAVVAPQTSITQGMVGTRVETTGVWEPELTYWVPDRMLDGLQGYLLVTALRESGTEALLPVVRGWVPVRDDSYLEVPAGEVSILGFLDASEAAAAAPGGGEIEAVSTGTIVNVWGGPIYSGYVILIESDPAAGGPGSGPAGIEPIAAMAPPVMPSAELNVRNLVYAAEWFVFGGFALVLWARMVRDEVRARREDEAEVGAEQAEREPAPAS